MLAQTHVEVEHRIRIPLRFHLLYRQTGEQFLLPREVAVQC